MTQPIATRRAAPAHARSRTARYIEEHDDELGLEGDGSRHLEVVRRRRRRLNVAGQTRARILVGGGALLAVVVAFALVLLHVEMAQRQFQLDRLSTQVTQAQSQYSQLRLQVAQLEAPQQIISTAEGQLGMRQPANVTYLTPSSPMPSATTEPAAGGSSAGSAGSTSSTSSTSSAGSAGSTSSAPSGDADWPQVKSQLAGSP